MSPTEHVVQGLAVRTRRRRYSVDSGASLSIDVIIFVLRKEHDTEARRVLDIKASIGVTVSDVQAKIQKGSLVVDLLFVLSFGRVCKRALVFFLMADSRDVPDFQRKAKSVCVWHRKLHPPWCKVKPSKVILTATGDSAKRKRRKPGFWSCQSQLQKV